MKRILSQEEYHNEEFLLLGVSPHITHLKQPEDSYYSVITVATPYYMPYHDIADYLAVIFASASDLKLKGSDLDRFLVKRFSELDYGVAPCHQGDQFSTKIGRIMSEGRLLKILRALRAGGSDE